MWSSRLPDGAASCPPALLYWTPPGLLESILTLSAVADLFADAARSRSEGEFARLQIISRASGVSEITRSEQRYAEQRGLKPGRRLGCNAKVLANCVIDIPPESQVHRQVVRKRAEVRDIEIRPVTRLHYVDVREPDLHDQSSDFRRLCESLREQWPNWGIADDISCDYAVLTSLQKALRDGAWKVTVALRGNDRVVAVWPGFRTRSMALPSISALPPCQAIFAILQPGRYSPPLAQ